MAKKHLKRLNVPSNWRIKKKDSKFIMRPNPGPHSMKASIALGVIIRDMLGFADNSKETKFMLNNRSVLVNGTKRKDLKFPVGLFDTIEFVESNKYYRVIFDKKGKIALIEIEKSECGKKPCRIKAKTKKIGNKTQLCLYDGTIMVLDKDEYKVDDTLLIEFPKKDIKEHLKFEKGALIYLIGGKHKGETGKVEDIKGDKISYKNNAGDIAETLKKYGFVIGKDKPTIKLN